MVTKILNKSHFHVRLIVGGPLVLFACFFIINPVQAVNNESLENFGDIAQIALPVIGLGATWGYSDKEGAKQWLWTGVTSVGTTTVLKEVYEKVRPNAAQSATSFPSGHTTGAFFGAAFLDQRPEFIAPRHWIPVKTQPAGTVSVAPYMPGAPV